MPTSPGGSPFFSFRSRWSVPLPASGVYATLVDVAAYPSWWPQVRAVARLAEDTALVRCRSALPYTLEFTLRSVREEYDAGVLEAELDGDLDGWSRWTVCGTGRGTDLLYEQEVTTSGPAMAVASRVARPVLELNHAWMMRGGRRGLLRAAGRSSRAASPSGPRRTGPPPGPPRG
jgi:hypothetical protein